ncbi:nitronate monooxygenase [Mycobacterium sp. 3519A]|uniref:nitronate monooxygenase n=1 Tax=Mycobacterium sp. 3519A TaxID=2057184 RepID=UPI000C7B0B02
MVHFVFNDLTVPVIVAPMAGGPSTPQLCAAATNSGGLGVVAAGLLSTEACAHQAAEVRRLSSGPLAVNLFVPTPVAAIPQELEQYAEHLRIDAARFGVEVGRPRHDTDWQPKLDMLCDIRPDMVSFTFGLPSPAEVKRLQAVGASTTATVTTVAEARIAAAIGVDALVTQGPEAGGHRGTLDPREQPATEALPELVAAVTASVDIPVVGAGGIATASDVSTILGSGAAAVQLGTAFLLADEAGTHQVYRAALQSDEFSETVVTRSFTGRYARAIRNRFTDDHSDQAPFGFPEIGFMTAPLLAAAAEAGDAQGLSLFAGSQFRRSRPGPVAEIMGRVTDGLCRR